MRGPEKEAIVVRNQEGELVEKVEELRFIRDRYPILGVPLIRGTVNFLDSMVHGVRALMYSADFYPDEEASQPSKFELWLERHLSSKKLESVLVTLAVVLGVGMSVFLFMVLPTFLTGGLLHFFPVLSPVGAESAGGFAEDCHLPCVFDCLLPSERYLSGLSVPWGRAQNHLLL